MLRAASYGLGQHAADHISLGMPRLVITPTGAIAQSAVPVILAPNGTIATNGIVTLGTPLPNTYSGGAWVRFPANAVVGGAAGMYWTVFTNATTGQVSATFVDPATAEFIPRVSSGANAVGSNAGYLQTTGSGINLANITIPGGSIGVNGILNITALINHDNVNNNKITTIKLGAGTIISQTDTTTASFTYIKRGVANRGAANRQVVHNSPVVGGTSSVAMAEIAVDTAQNQSFTIAGNLSTATGFIILELFALEVLQVN